MTELTMPRLGVERSERQYPTRTLSASGSIAFGSDWPVSSADPLEGIAIAISRQTVAGVPDEGWVPDETVDIETALGAYSTSVARLAFADKAPATWGRLTPGAEADLVWLDRDPITCAGPERLRALTVRASYLSGEPWPAGRVP
jgi:predicted amidohydrolase YtcJ